MELKDEEIKRNIIKYLMKKEKNTKEGILEKYKIKVKKTEQGAWNENYFIEVNDNILYFYKKFYTSSSLLNAVSDKEFQAIIGYELGKKNLGPKLIKNDEEKNSYRIDEYIPSRGLNPNEVYLPKTIHKLTDILIYYSGINNFFSFDLDMNSPDLISNIQPILINKNSLNCENILKFFSKELSLANKSLKKFLEDATDFYSKNKGKNPMLINGKNLYDKIPFVNKSFETVKEKLMLLIPKINILCLCHNDVNSTNILYNEERQKMYLIDNEFAMLNFIGSDLTNYFYNSLAEYENAYFRFANEKVDFELYYKYFVEFIDKFHSHYQQLFKECPNKNLYKELRSQKYFYQIFSLSSLFMNTMTARRVDFQTEFILKTGFPRFTNLIDQVVLFESLYPRLQKL